ncbi:MAG TPA: HEAT repeat domain-containing protein, partial [Candidatus Binataceae bacterium]|nr:HEAT repeat domain-containing protein [Candidatus Binataceae bacterium]
MNGKRSVRGAAVAALLMLLAAVPIRTARAQTGEHASPSAASVSNLIQELRSPDLRRRRDAARELSNIEPLPSEAIAALAQALQDEQPNGAVENYASIGLSKAGARAIPALAELTRSGNPQARQAAIATLGRMAKSTPDAWPLLIDAFRQPSGRGAAYVWGIADQLARVGPPVIPLLRKALEDPDPHVRAGAAATLAQMGDFDRHWSRNNPYVRK